MKLGKKAVGLLGEEIGYYYLKSEGYKILCRNYRTRYGEIDIIAEDGSDIIFVEVKLRLSDSYGGVEEHLLERQKRRILLSAQEYFMLESKEEEGEEQEEKGLRIDYIGIKLMEGRLSLEHIKDVIDGEILERVE